VTAREDVLAYADAAQLHLDRHDDMSLAVTQLIHGLRATAVENASGATTPPRPHAARRPSVRVAHNLRPQRCTTCGPDVSPHDESLWMQWHEGSARMGRAACERALPSLLLSALAGQVAP
jgi:hypothetical protein